MFRLAPIVVLLASTVTFAQSTRPASRDVSPLVAGVLAKHHAPGLVGAIVGLDGATAVGVAGVRKVGSPEPLAVGDAIHLGSDTKAMTATLIARLVDAGDLTYDTTMADAFPAFADAMDAAMARATVEQLLGHRAGLPANVAWGLYAMGAGGLAQQRLRVARDALALKPLDAPGATYVYSNVGYTILGAIVDARAKRPWEQVIRDELFAPLGMATAGFGPPDVAFGHLRANDAWRPTLVDNPEVMSPAGRVHCSVEDWARYVAFVLRSQRADTPVLSSAAARRLLAPLPGETYAGGWMLTNRPWAGGATLTHAGSNGAWYCVAWLAPQRGFAVLAATNAADADAGKACDDLCAALIASRAN